MAKILVGPMLRFAGETEATIWVETDVPCRVSVLGSSEPTFTVEGHHYALVVVGGLESGSATEYSVELDGERAWPPPDYELPPPRIRTRSGADGLRLLFGSCRCAAPHRPPFTFQRWWHRSGKGLDALLAYARRMVDQPSAMWPDAVALLGDQLYADQPPPQIREAVAEREIHADGPMEVLEDFEEYTLGYRYAWREPLIRWLLSTTPTAMIFDDHEINDKWRSSRRWMEQMRRTDWYSTRIVGGLMAYWLYQHLGNLSPGELAADETLARLRAGEDGGKVLRSMAERAERQEGHSRFSFSVDYGPARLIAIDSRAGRELEEGRRRIVGEEEWRWVSERARGGAENVILASSVPFLLPQAMHDVESWSEAVDEGAWGSRLRTLGERVRMAANLDHWAAFRRSFAELEDLVEEIVSAPPDQRPGSMIMLGGDVHHCYLSEAEVPGHLAHPPVWHVTCSGIRKELQLSERLVLGAGHTRWAAALARLLARSAGVHPPRLRWRQVSRSRFRNQIGTLEIADGEAAVRIEQVTGGARRPGLRAVIERRLL